MFRKLLTLLLVGLLSFSVNAATIKTFNGTAIASVKTINGTAKASIKTYNGDSLPASSTFKVFAGTYTGTGSSLGVTGVGFQPQVLWIKANGTATDDDPVMAWDGMGGDSSHGFKSNETSTNQYTDLITAYGSDGFTVGTNAASNTSGKTYYFLAIRGASTEVAIGNYGGNGSDGRDITTTLTGTPDFVVIKTRDNSARAFGRFSGESGDASMSYTTPAAEQTNRIQGFGTGTFNLGTNGDVNANTFNYDYMAMDIPSGAGESATYSGNGSDNHDITLSSGITPTAVFIKNNADSWVLRTSANTGDDSTILENSAANASNRVQSLGSGTFQVGTDSDVNTSSSTYFYWAIKSAP